MIEFWHNISLIYGAKGKAWLENLPVLQNELAHKWHLRDLAPCADLSYNYIVYGWQNDSPIILKIGCDQEEIRREHDALKAFAGHGMVELMDADLKSGAILISRAIPGASLVSLFPGRDIEALEIACKLIDNLHKASLPGKHKLPQLSEWLGIIDQRWDLPIKQLQLSRKLRDDLLQNSHKQVLLHGDVHYANILADGKSWLMIDPKGVIGDPLYDFTGCLLREPFAQLMAAANIEQILKRRIDFVAKYTKTTAKTIWAWTYVQTVMSICWSLEDGQDVAHKREFLDILESFY